MKKVDRLTVFGSTVFAIIGIFMIYCGLFLHEQLDAWYLTRHGIGITESVNVVIRNVGFAPISIIMGLLCLVSTVIVVCREAKVTKLNQQYS